MPQQGMTDRSRLRKRPLETDAATNARAAGEIDIAGCATIAYSSEDPAHPVEHMLDGRSGPGAPAGSALAPTPPNTSSLSLTGRRRSRASSMRSRRRCGSVPKKCAWKSRRTAADRTAKFWFRNTTSAPGEPPTSAKNSASISAKSPISVSRLFQTRADPARRRSQRSAFSPRGLKLHNLSAAAQVPARTYPGD